eukprot:SM000035S13100  [mRNA]  locus=s35:448882:452671:+ [translate_table: standard]
MARTLPQPERRSGSEGAAVPSESSIGAMGGAFSPDVAETALGRHAVSSLTSAAAAATAAQAGRTLYVPVDEAWADPHGHYAAVAAALAAQVPGFENTTFLAQLLSYHIVTEHYNISKLQAESRDQPPEELATLAPPSTLLRLRNQTGITFRDEYSSLAYITESIYDDKSLSVMGFTAVLIPNYQRLVGYGQPVPVIEGWTLVSQGGSSGLSAGAVAGIVIAAVVVAAALCCLLFVTLCRRSSGSGTSKSFRDLEKAKLYRGDSDWTFLHCQNFTVEELDTATKHFSEDLVLGEGGFGKVYKGVLKDSREVAVKMMREGSKQGVSEFRAELDIISRIHHRHLVGLLGACLANDHLLLVYDYVPHGNLHQNLHEKHMDWATRMKVARGAARGIAYLHEDCNPRIIHRDIKAPNILLDAQDEALVADFGLAKLADDMLSHITTRVMGTFGSARPMLVSERFEELVDPLLAGDYDSAELNTIAAAAALCVQDDSQLRPPMGKISSFLEGDALSRESSLGSLSQARLFMESPVRDPNGNTMDFERFKTMAKQNVFNSDSAASKESSGQAKSPLTQVLPR